MLELDVHLTKDGQVKVLAKGDKLLKKVLMRS